MADGHRGVFASKPISFWALQFGTILGVVALAVIGGNQVDHTFTREHCGLGTALSLFATKKERFHPDTACRFIVVTFDLPSLLLGLGIVLSLCVYVYFVQMLRHFDELRDAGATMYVFPVSSGPAMVTVAGAPRGLRRAFDSTWLRHPAAWARWMLPRSVFVNWLRPPRAVRFVVAAALTGTGLLFHWLASRNGYLFASIAEAQKLPGDSQDLARTWWADWHEHPYGAAVWIAIGVTGAYVAVIDLYMSAKMAEWLTGGRRRTGASGEAKSGRVRVAMRSFFGLDDSPGVTVKEPDELELRVTVDNGVRHLVILQDLKFAGMFNFAIVLVALVFLCRDPDAVGAWDGALAFVIVAVVAFSLYAAIVVRNVRLRMRYALFCLRVESADLRRDRARRPGPTPRSAAVAEIEHAETMAAARWLYSREDTTLFSRGANVGAVLATLYGTLFAIFPSVRPF